jgi:hypothetical protein
MKQQGTLTSNRKRPLPFPMPVRRPFRNYHRTTERRRRHCALSELLTYHSCHIRPRRLSIGRGGRRRIDTDRREDRGFGSSDRHCGVDVVIVATWCRAIKRSIPSITQKTKAYANWLYAVEDVPSSTRIDELSTGHHSWTA